MNHQELKIFNEPLLECPLCGSVNISLLYIIKKYTPEFKVDRCHNCGFIFMNLRFTDEQIKAMYNESYYTGSAEYSYYDERQALKYSQYVWKKRVRKIKKYISGGNFLDVGCSFGGLLETASKYFIPYGLEISEYSCSNAKKIFGDNVHNGTLSDHPFKHGEFSVVTMIELLEHLSDPVAAVSECFHLLRDGGLLVIQTANMDALQAKCLKDKYAYFMPGHVSYFTKSNLAGLLKKTGFKRIKVFYPVEFGLLPKLLKSRYGFRSFVDYLKWLRISYYHYISKIRFRNFAMTSSMVIYAFK